jgi:hypothetical protein
MIVWVTLSDNFKGQSFEEQKLQKNCRNTVETSFSQSTHEGWTYVVQRQSLEERHIEQQKP